MANIHKSSIKGVVLRAIALDGCGEVLGGPNNYVTSKGFTRVNMDPQLTSGQEFEVPNADGELIVNDVDAPRLKRYNATIDLANVSPEILSLMTKNRIITRSGIGVTDNVGIGVGENASADDGGFSLEVWTRVSGGNCGESGDRWFYWAAPWLTQGRLGAFNIERNPLTLTVTAVSRGNPNFGRGPFELFDVAIPADEHWDWQVTSVAPPTATEGYGTLP